MRIRNTSTRFVLVCCGLVGFAGCSTAPPRADTAAAALFGQQELFTSGANGYHTYRIPALAVTRHGDILAFCEGRKVAAADSGDIDILLRRSTDGGRTWGAPQLVSDDGPHTMGNPCVVVDRNTGTVWLLLTRNLGEDRESEILARTSKGTRTVWVCRSDDDGATWTRPAEITPSVKPPDWTWYATGPGCGIQLRSGRLVVPCDHSLPGPGQIWRAHIIYSDDHGRSWQLGGIAKEDVNECQVVELADGSLMLNMRNYARGEGRQNRRAVATSRDGGLTWSEPAYAAELVEPVCQAALICLSDLFARRVPGLLTPRLIDSPKDNPAPLLFSNPAGTKRENMTVRISYDEGRTWPSARQVHAGPAAYSALALMPDKTIGLLYEHGEKNPYERITFARFNLEWLTAQ